MKEIKNYHPNIFPIKMPTENYIYDASRNEFISVEDELFKYILCLFDKKGEIQYFNPNVKEQYDSLIKQGYLQNKQINKIHHPYTECLELLLQRNMSQILLQVTQSCNFQCTYCVYTASIDGMQRKHSNKHMRWDTAKKAVDYLWQHSVDSDTVTIGFYGGEPLLEFDLIKNVILYANHMFEGKNIHYAMTTNGSLLTLDKVDFLYKNNVHLVLSIDGPKEIQNKNRRYGHDGKGSYEIVLNNVKQIRKFYPQYVNQLEINTVINPLDDLDLVYSAFQRTGDFCGIQTMATLINDSSLKEKNIKTEKYLIQFEYHTFILLLTELGLIKSNKSYPLSEIIIKSAKKNIDTKYIPSKTTPEQAAPGGMCLPGVHKLFVTADEKLFVCERTNEPSEAGYLGTLSNGIDIVRARKMLNIAQLTDVQCKKCWAFRYCRNCVAQCDNGSNASRELRLKRCIQTRSSVAYVFRVMILLLNRKKLTDHRKDFV